MNSIFYTNSKIDLTIFYLFVDDTKEWSTDRCLNVNSNPERAHDADSNAWTTEPASWSKSSL